MAHDEALVSVVIPAYNAERTLGATLDSVRRQTYGNLEIVVVDDGSRDATADVARRYATEDARIRLVSIPNGGVANARNTGIAETTGAFVAPLDSDDIWHPEKIALQMRTMREGGEEMGYVYCFSRRIDGQDRVLRNVKTYPIEGRIYLRSIVFNPVGNGSTILARRRALEEAGGFNPDPDMQGAEDNLMQILMNRYWRVGVVPFYLTGYREVATSLSADFSRMALRRFAVLRHVRERFPETPDTVFAAAEGRLRAILATQALRRNRIGQGMGEFARAFRKAPSCAVELVSVDTAARLRNGLRSATGRQASSGPGQGFYRYDPASGADSVPRRPYEQRMLNTIAGTEEAFFQSSAFRPG